NLRRARRRMSESNSSTANRVHDARVHTERVSNVEEKGRNMNSLKEPQHHREIPVGLDDSWRAVRCGAQFRPGVALPREPMAIEQTLQLTWSDELEVVEIGREPPFALNESCKTHQPLPEKRNTPHFKVRFTGPDIVRSLEVDRASAGEHARHLRNNP